MQPKVPLSADKVQAITNAHVASKSLPDVHFLFILLVAFYGFFRVNEINSLSFKDVAINYNSMKIFVAKHKNDQYREGHTSHLTRSAKSTCPVAIKLELQSSDTEYLLDRRVVKAKSREYFHSSKEVSLTTLRDDFKKHIEPFVNDVFKFGTHNIKSGAASNHAYGSIPGDILDIHTR